MDEQAEFFEISNKTYLKRILECINNKSTGTTFHDFIGKTRKLWIDDIEINEDCVRNMIIKAASQYIKYNKKFLCCMAVDPDPPKEAGKQVELIRKSLSVHISKLSFGNDQKTEN